MRLRVQKAVDELGYTPHGVARALASQRSNTIGAVIPTLHNAIFATVVQALQNELTLKGQTLLLAASDYRPEQECDQIEKLLVRGIDGLRVCDAAAMPTQITGNLYATVVAMAEKASDMILGRAAPPAENPREIAA